MIEKILQDLISGIDGARAVIFLDGDGESIAQAGDANVDLKFLGAWKEIHLDHIKEITEKLGLGTVKAVLFSLEHGNELIVPVVEDYSLLLVLSPYAVVQDAMNGVQKAVEDLKKDIS